MFPVLEKRYSMPKIKKKRSSLDVSSIIHYFPSKHYQTQFRLNKSENPMRDLSLSPVLDKERKIRDKAIHQELLQNLKKSDSIGSKLKTLQSAWEEIAKSLKETQTLTEVFQQLFSLVKEPSNLQNHDIDSIISKNKDLEALYKVEKEYSSTLEHKLKRLSEENSELFSKNKTSKEKLNLWIEMSSSFSYRKMPIFKYEDLLFLCKDKNKQIEEMNDTINSLKSSENELLNIVKSQTILIKKLKMHMNKHESNPVYDLVDLEEDKISEILSSEGERILPFVPAPAIQ